MTRVIVVGASSGIGAALVRQLAARGVTVAAIGRRHEALEAVRAAAPQQIRIYPFDSTAVDEVPELFERIHNDVGRIDGLIYSAGAMPAIAESEYSFAKDRDMVEVNLLGAMAWMNIAAAKFEAARRGTIAGISSVAGDRGRRKNPGYAATKAALTTYLEGLRNRCSRYGINVVTAKPGFVDTDMTKGLPGLFWLISADEAARRILALIDRQSSASGYVPKRWGLVMAIIRAIPSAVFRRLNV